MYIAPTTIPFILSLCLSPARYTIHTAARTESIGETGGINIYLRSQCRRKERAGGFWRAPRFGASVAHGRRRSRRLGTVCAVVVVPRRDRLRASPSRSLTLCLSVCFVIVCCFAIIQYSSLFLLSLHTSVSARRSIPVPAVHQRLYVCVCTIYIRLKGRAAASKFGEYTCIYIYLSPRLREMYSV